MLSFIDQRYVPSVKFGYKINTKMLKMQMSRHNSLLGICFRWLFSWVGNKIPGLTKLTTKGRGRLADGP